MLQKKDGRYEVYGNPITSNQTRAVDKWKDMLTNDTDLLELFCDCIVKNKSIGIYDGAYKSVELATGRKFVR